MQINYKIIRQLINQKAKYLHALAPVFNEVSARMNERLDYIKIKPSYILDIGSGLGYDTRNLQQRFPQSRVYQVDIAVNLLKMYRHKTIPWWKKLVSSRPESVCANAKQLPFADQSLDMVWSNLCLPYIDNVEEYFKEVNRILKPDGCLLISGLGIDSLQQLRQLGLKSANFPDMHMIGDLLFKLGFSDPVTDMEYITLEYQNYHQLLHDIRIIGCGAAITDSNISQAPRLSKATYYELESRFAALQQNGTLPLTLEIFYAHAWKKPSLAHNDTQIIQFLPKATR